MENYIHLSAETPTLFCVEGQNLGTSQSNQDYITIVSDQQNLNIACYPLNDTETKIPQMLNLNFLGNTLFANNEFAQSYLLANNHFKVCISLPTAIIFRPNVLQKNISFDTIQLSLFDGTMQYVLIQNNNKNYKITLNKHIKKASFQVFGQYYALLGKTGILDYVLIFDQLGNTIFEESNDKIELKSNTILTLQKMHDIARHGYVCTYTIDNNLLKTKEQYSVYLDEHPYYAQNQYTIGLAFLEAVNIGNIDLARYYLSDQLNSILSTEQITGYFGNYLEFEPNFLTNANNTIFFMYPDNIVKLYTFKVQYNKIVDITTD